MPAVTVDVRGASALKAALGKVAANIQREVEAELAAEAETVAAEARANVRVDSGDLRDTISAEVEGTSATVAPRTELSEDSPQQHAIKANVNEFGRSKDPGQPYMVPAAEASRARWPGRAAEAVKRGAHA